MKVYFKVGLDEYGVKDYKLLVGPDNFKCKLGETQDDYWWDGHIVVEELNKLALDKARLDFLERNILSITHDNATNSVDMSGNCLTLTVENENKGAGAGPTKLRIRGKTIREVIDKAADWNPKELKE